jgi:hypothetical protein
MTTCARLRLRLPPWEGQVTTNNTHLKWVT